MSSNLGPRKKLGLLLGVSVAGLVFTIVALGVYPTASNQGYAPEQPIPFSHRLHAGQYKIECRYCHVGVTESRHATVPAMNVCMNCHRVVKVDSPHIQKLHEHYNSGKPIEWVRVHELPDFVFFNHKRHVAKGVSCETCHGDVRGMERVVQSAPLTMGWCMSCHRGETTPEHVLRGMGLEQGDDGRAPVAPTNCTTCHY